MNEVNICFLTDNGYAMPTCVAMTSMLLNKNNDSKYNIYILCINVSNNCIDKFMKLNREDFKINIIELNDKYQDFNMKGVSASATAMYKFSIPEILDNIDKVIYLDGDILINSDLLELYNQKIDDECVCAVKDINGTMKRHYNCFIKNSLFYFNSGVMLMNLSKMRKLNISKELIDYRINGYNELMDQDALNYILKNKVKEIPFKYNTQTMYTFINKNVDEIKKIVIIDDKCIDYEDIAKKSLILHYSMKNKPWKSQKGFMFDVWMYYYYKSPYKEEIINRKQVVDKKTSNIYVKIKALEKNYRRLRFFKKFSTN